MESKFTPEFFKANRARLKELFTGSAPIVITSNGLMQKSTSETYPYKQDGNFWYLTGIDEPNLILVMDKNKEYLIASQLSQYQEIFDGSLNFEQLSVRSGVATVLSNKAGWKLLQSRIKKVKNVATISAPAPYVETYGMYTNPARAILIQKLKDINSDLVLLDLSQHFQRMRMVKQPVEIQAIQKAIDATIEGLIFVKKTYLEGKYIHEQDVYNDLNSKFWKSGAKNHSFDPIIAGGERGLILHAPDKLSLDPGKQLLLDVGAEYDHYAADISRTWTSNPSKRFLAVHQTVIDVSDYAASLLVTGVTLRNYEKQVEHYMGEKLRMLGLIKIINRENVRKYFPHATSHFLGFDVHDVGDYERPLEPNVVLTVEPGIYIPQEGIGIRIEDDYILTSTSIKNLSNKLNR